MEKEQDIFADFKKEGENPFQDMGEETPTESQTVNEPEEDVTDTSKEEKESVPFHKHPRWIEREQELQELRERDAERDRQIAELLAAQERTKETSTIPDWFVELYGDNQTAWEKYSAHEQARTAEIEARVLAKQQEEQKKAAQEEQFYAKWVDEQVDALETSGLKFDRNELIKIMVEYSPTDGDNNLDFRKGYAIYEALHTKPDTEKSDARKQLADTTTTTSRNDAPKKDYMTPADLRNRSWGSL